MGCGGVPRSTCCLSGCGSVALALCSGFPSPPCPRCVVQAKHRSLEGSAAAEAVLQLLGWGHTKSLPVCAGTSFRAFQQVFGKELAGSCVRMMPGLCRHAGRNGGGSHPDVGFPGCPWPSKPVLWGSGRRQWGSGSHWRLLQTCSAETHPQPRVPGASAEPPSRLPRHSSCSLPGLRVPGGRWPASCEPCLPVFKAGSRGPEMPPGAGRELWGTRTDRAWWWFACFPPAYPRDACSGPLQQKAPCFSLFRWPVTGTAVLLPSSAGLAAAWTPGQHPPGLDPAPIPRRLSPCCQQRWALPWCFIQTRSLPFCSNALSPGSPRQDCVFPLFISDISMRDLQVEPTYVPSLLLCLPRGNSPKPEREAAAVVLPASPRAGRRSTVCDTGWDARTDLLATALLVMQPACCLCDFTALSYNFQSCGGVIQQRFNFTFCLGEPAGSWLGSTPGF